MQIKLTKEIIDIQALLLYELNISEDSKTGRDGDNAITMRHCYDLLAKTYGFKDGDELKKRLNE